MAAAAFAAPIGKVLVECALDGRAVQPLRYIEKVDRVRRRRRIEIRPLDASGYEVELALFQEYRAVLSMFKYVVETERRFYMANDVKVTPHCGPGATYFEVELGDAWVWDMYRPARFVSSVRVVTYKDVNVEALPEKDG